MRKQFDIKLGGSLMCDNVFDTLANDVMLGGIKHRRNKRTIEYDLGAYLNVKCDMRAFKHWCEEQGFKVKGEYRNTFYKTNNGELTAMIIAYPIK